MTTGVPELPNNSAERKKLVEFYDQIMAEVNGEINRDIVALRMVQLAEESGLNWDACKFMQCRQIAKRTSKDRAPKIVELQTDLLGFERKDVAKAVFTVADGIDIPARQARYHHSIAVLQIAEDNFKKQEAAIVRTRKVYKPIIEIQSSNLLLTFAEALEKLGLYKD